MNRHEPEFSDNVFVLRNKWNGNEYLSLYIEFNNDWNTMESNYEYQPISLTRYCVPGRIDTYSFCYWQRRCGYGNRITYFSEGSTPLNRITPMLIRDLNRPRVVGLVREACRKLKLWQLNMLSAFLYEIAGSTKSYKVVNSVRESIQQNKCLTLK